MQPAFQHLLRRSDQLSGRCPQPAEGIRQAIVIAELDPEMALTRSRKVLDYIVRRVYELALREPAGSRPLDGLLQRLVKEGHWPWRLAAYANTVRELGNVATHSFTDGISTADVVHSLEQLFPIADWFAGQEGAPSATVDSGEAPALADVTADRLGSAADRSIVVPKGLRSFDAADSDFFLTLLPGPRDRNGLPDSLRFWKDRIEPTRELAFPVGLLYGPSGCGKSSLVKAGPLPRLAPHVRGVYVEATAEDTEARILRALRRRCPQLPATAGLVESFVLLRTDAVVPAGEKVLLVLDQFEQWLHARRADARPELVQALRQCDGQRVQCVVMVRDDFWLAVSRFLHHVEIRLLEGQNTALVDLFDLLHARKVLALFGRAYGRLPEGAAELTPEQEQFLDHAVAGLAQDGKVISVRLALFAEMVKGKPWTPATLRDVGGAEGIGAAFLEETLSAPTAPAEHRLHQKAARAVLRSLLPEKGGDIKGHMRSQQELMEVSEYVRRPQQFADLMRILDTELRLVTPTDPEGPDAEEDAAAPAAPKVQYYQLTHDYLVHSLRQWLTRKQRETRRGRAELRLADRATLWTLRPENRHLPKWWEWLGILRYTRGRDWLPPQRRMMRNATQYYLLRGAIFVLLVTAFTAAGLYARNQYITDQNKQHASGLVDRLLVAEAAQVPAVVDDMRAYRAWTDPRLQEIRKQPDATPKEHQEQLYASLALLPTDPTQADYLCGRMLTADYDQFPVIRDALKPRQDELIPRLWGVLEDDAADGSQRFRAGMALATYAPPAGEDDARWRQSAPFLVKYLLDTLGKDPAHYNPILTALRPVRGSLLEAFGAVFRDANRPESERRLATNILADYASDQPEFLADLILDGDAWQHGVLLPKLQPYQDHIVPRLEAELAKSLAPRWNDDTASGAWQPPDAALTSAIEGAQGLCEERFALCQTMPLEEFASVAERLRPIGYRPVCFRPYASGNGVQVSATWARDGRDWRMISGVTAEEVRDQDRKWRAKGYIPVDVTGYVAPAAEGRRVDYGALWVTPGPEVESASLYVGVSDGAATDKTLAPYLKEGYLPRTLAPCELDGQRWNSGVWYKPRSPIDGDGRVYGFGRGQWWYESKLTPSRFQLDVRLAPVGGQRVARTCR